MLAPADLGTSIAEGAEGVTGTTDRRLLRRIMKGVFIAGVVLFVGALGSAGLFLSVSLLGGY